MITYVNTVFVSNANGNTLAVEADDIKNIKKGQFVIYDVDNSKGVGSLDETKRFKIGMGTGKTAKDHKGVSYNEIKWSNIIDKEAIKSVSALSYEEDTEDTVMIDFSGIDASVMSVFALGGKRIIIRLTFKDLPTRYRKWTESYEYVTREGDTAETIATGIAELINKQWKRARVEATANNGVVTLVAMKYDDDDSVDTINWAEQVRFNANVYYTDPAAEGWESLNKHFPKGLTIKKEPGKHYPASAKLVRDRESQAMGYLGILNRGECTWPIIKPAMETNLDLTYDAVTLEFENTYRAADDIFRKTKQSVEIYGAEGTITNLINVLTNIA